MRCATSNYFLSLFPLQDFKMFKPFQFNGKATAYLYSHTDYIHIYIYIYIYIYTHTRSAEMYSIIYFICSYYDA
jgi:hypothetical protein